MGLLLPVKSELQAGDASNISYGKKSTGRYIRGFQTGADDYITKPFSMEELILRIEAILRRTTGGVAVTKKEDSY